MGHLILPLLGGALIGCAALLLLHFHGRIAGISGIVAGMVSPRTTSRGWRAAFLVGLAAGGLGTWLLAPARIGAPVVHHPAVWLGGGLLVGIGARVGGGCTSGHGVCGIGSLSGRSLIATVTFIGTGVATVLVARSLGAL
jgi:uncharacterized membrane protein YedE/YeeE